MINMIRVQPVTDNSHLLLNNLFESIELLLLHAPFQIIFCYLKRLKCQWLL